MARCCRAVEQEQRGAGWIGVDAADRYNVQLVFIGGNEAARRSWLRR